MCFLFSKLSMVTCLWLCTEINYIFFVHNFASACKIFTYLPIAYGVRRVGVLDVQFPMFTISFVNTNRNSSDIIILISTT